MGGRAQSLRLHPFASVELPSIDWKKALTFGTLPPVYLSDSPRDELRSYFGDYLREEIAAEGLVRKIGPFSRFLETAAISHTRELNFEAIGRDAQVPARTVREHYAVLQDTLLGEVLLPLQAKSSRKLTAHGKFYFFDIGVPHGLLKVHDRDLETLVNVGDELKLARRIVVCRERHRRRVGKVEILPLAEFCAELWSGALTSGLR